MMTYEEADELRMKYPQRHKEGWTINLWGIGSANVKSQDPWVHVFDTHAEARAFVAERYPELAAHFVKLKLAGELENPPKHRVIR